MSRPEAETIKLRVPLDLLLERIGLEPNRAGYISCPAHTDKTPSLKIYDNPKGWYCFGCSQGGTVIDFYMHFYGVGFVQAVEGLGQMFGLGGEIDQETKMQIQRREFESNRRRIKESEEEHWRKRWLKSKRTLELFKDLEPIEGEWPMDLVQACQNIAYEEYRWELAAEERKEDADAQNKHR